VTASWRRAVLSLEDHQKAWLLWNYSENIRFEYQVAHPVGVGRVREQLGAKKVAGKTGAPEETFWLAAQDVKASWLGGRRMNIRRWRNWRAWHKITGQKHCLTGWLCAQSLSGLMAVRLSARLRSRSQQKATNSSSLAK
jgi:hypothetical protein